MGPDWRADALARSRHSRLADELVAPLEDHDEERAERICAEICRLALGDFAPALILLPAAERRRTRVLGSFALVLFDFAAKCGLDGDRLAEINRWEFRLEEALAGHPAGQPIFVLLAREEARRPWPRPALDRLLAAARRRAMGAGESAGPLPAARSVAAALAAALLETDPSEGIQRLGAAALRVAGGGPTTAPRSLEAELDGALEAGPEDLPSPWRPAATYLRLAARRLLRARQAGVERPALGLPTRIALLVRARLLRR